MTATPKPDPNPRATRARLPREAIAILVNAAGAGNQSAWNRLVQEFEGLIWAIARAHRLRDADAADVSQATWLALLEHLGDLKDPARWAPGLRRRHADSVCACCGKRTPRPVRRRHSRARVARPVARRHAPPLRA